MSGVIIAKPGFDVSSSPEHHYVNTTTPLLKVYKNITGVLDTDGVTYTSEGEYEWEGEVKPAGERTFLSLTVPYNLGYVPMVVAYLDTMSGKNRRYVTSSTAGVALEGNVYGSLRIHPTYMILDLANASPNGDTSKGLLAGRYGYQIIIYHLPLTPPGEKDQL